MIYRQQSAAAARRGQGLARCARRRALTLVELLVVIAILGLLIAVLLPAVQAARETARGTACSNNLRQIGAALATYHVAIGSFPPGNVTKETGICYGDGKSAGGGWPSDDGANWCLSILAYLGEEPLYRAYDFEDFNEAATNAMVRQTMISTYVCPSDLNPDELGMPASGPANAAALALQYRPGSYRAVTGSSDGLTFIDSADLTTYQRSMRGPIHTVGVLDLATESYHHIGDGTSNTLLVGESTTSTRPSMRTFWAYAYAHYSLSAVTPQPRVLIGDYDACVTAGGRGASMPCRRGWGGLHPAGIYYLICDGSVHLISRDVDMQLLATLATIDGAEGAQLP